MTTVQLYRQIIMALYGGYIALRVVWFWNSFTFGIFFGALFFSALNYFCLGAVQQALELGTSVSGAQDVLFVNWAVMVLSILSDKAFYLYLSIPAYLLYQYGPMIKNYLMPPQQPVVSGGNHTSHGDWTHTRTHRNSVIARTNCVVVCLAVPSLTHRYSHCLILFRS